MHSPSSHRLDHHEERAREEKWREATADVIAIAHDRYATMAQILKLSPTASHAFIDAAMEATRQYQTGCMYANYEKRTGHPYPDEGRDNEEDAWRAAWETQLTQLRRALG